MRTLVIKNSELEKDALDLLNNGYLLIKNFLTKNEINYLTKNFGDKQNLNHTGDDHEYHKFSVKYFYPISKDCDEVISKIILRCLESRNRIILQENFDQFLIDYCQRYQIDGDASEKLIRHQLKHTFCRYAIYSEGEGQIPHYDNPGEIQCIIPLSSYGIDYLGGLNIYQKSHNTNLLLDNIANIGDLILLNAYAFKHSVLPINSLTSKGRQHLFIATVPTYQFAPSYLFNNIYHLKGDLLHPIFIDETNLDKFSRTYLKIKYWLYALLNLVKPINSGYKG